MDYGKSSSSSSHGKVIIMILFLAMDMGLNSILDYDILNDQRPDNILLGVFGLQVVIQISIFLILFLATADTYLFRVGLLGVLVRTLRFVLLLHPLYMALTIATGAYRVRKLSGTDTLSTIWVDDVFITLSFLQKCVAIPYYIFNIRITIKLEDPIYYNKQAWINLIQQQKSSYE
jgi:hypothetical protein